MLYENTKAKQNNYHLDQLTVRLKKAKIYFSVLPVQQYNHMWVGSQIITETAIYLGMAKW